MYVSPVVQQAVEIIKTVCGHRVFRHPVVPSSSDRPLASAYGEKSTSNLQRLVASELRSLLHREDAAYILTVLRSQEKRVEAGEGYASPFPERTREHQGSALNQKVWYGFDADGAFKENREPSDSKKIIISPEEMIRYAEPREFLERLHETLDRSAQAICEAADILCLSKKSIEQNMNLYTQKLSSSRS